MRDRAGLRRLPPDDERDQFVAVEFFRVPHSDVAAVTHHRDPVADPQDVINAMRDEQAGDAGRAQSGQAREQLADLAGVQARRGFVEHDQPRTDPQCPGDRDDGLFGGRQLGDQPIDIDLDLEKCQRLARLPADPLRGDEPETGRIARSQRDVVRDRQCLDQTEILVDHRHPEVGPVRDRRAGHGCPEHGHGSAVGLFQPRENTDEGGFARSVLAEQRMDLPWSDDQAGVDERPRAPVDPLNRSSLDSRLGRL
jgi:hypothetical protein